LSISLTLDLRSGVTAQFVVGVTRHRSHDQAMKGEKVGEPRQTAKRTRNEQLRVRHWRRDEFIELGFSLSDATALAKSTADLTVGRRLIAEGCPHTTAFRILR
jgi:hypothetical protein